MKVHNKLIVIFSTLIFIFTLTSCIEVYQHIGLNENNTIHIFTKLSVSKLIMELGNSFSDNPEEIDYDEVLGDFSSKDLSKYKDLNPVINKINTDLEFGYSIAFDVENKDKEFQKYVLENNMYFMPIFEGNEIIFFMGSDAENSSIDSTSENFLISSKYRITISKSIKKSIKEVVLEYSDGIMNVVPDDLGDSYLIEIPMYSALEKDAMLIVR